MNFFSHEEQLKVVRKNAVARASIKEQKVSQSNQSWIDFRDSGTKCSLRLGYLWPSNIFHLNGVTNQSKSF